MSLQNKDFWNFKFVASINFVKVYLKISNWIIQGHVKPFSQLASISSSSNCWLLFAKPVLFNDKCSYIPPLVPAWHYLSLMQETILVWTNSCGSWRRFGLAHRQPGGPSLRRGEKVNYLGEGGRDWVDLCDPSRIGNPAEIWKIWAANIQSPYF